jgi:hypothetical protein
MGLGWLVMKGARIVSGFRSALKRPQCLADDAPDGSRCLSGVDVKQPLRIATVDAAIGRIPALAMGAQERQDKTF